MVTMTLMVEDGRVLGIPAGCRGEKFDVPKLRYGPRTDLCETAPSWPLTRQELRRVLAQIGQVMDPNVMMPDLGYYEKLLTELRQDWDSRLLSKVDPQIELLWVNTNYGETLWKDLTPWRNFLHQLEDAFIENERYARLPVQEMLTQLLDGSRYMPPYVDGIAVPEFGVCLFVLCQGTISVDRIHTALLAE